MNTQSCILCGYNFQEKLTFIRLVIYVIFVFKFGFAVNHPKTSKFNKAFEFSIISSYYSYNVHNNMFLLVSHYPDFLITSYIHAFENYVQYLYYMVQAWTPESIFERFLRKYCLF